MVYDDIPILLLPDSVEKLFAWTVLIDEPVGGQLEGLRLMTRAPADF